MLVKLRIAAPAGVEIVRAEVICVGFTNFSFVIRSIHSALCTVAHKMTQFFDRLLNRLGFAQNRPLWERVGIDFPHHLNATHVSDPRASVGYHTRQSCACLSTLFSRDRPTGQRGSLERSTAGMGPIRGQIGLGFGGSCCKAAGHCGTCVGKECMEGIQESTRGGLMEGKEGEWN